MSTITAHVPTQSGKKYVIQLCKHWAHKMPVDLDEETGKGTVPFASATVLMVPEETGIAVSINGDDRDDVERLTGVVARHLDRFAFREAPLTYDWKWQEEA